MTVTGKTLARNRRKKVTSVDKSNVLETSQLWRKMVVEVAAGCDEGAVLAVGSVAAMLEYSFGLKEEAAAVYAAIEAVLDSGRVTADLRPAGPPATTEQVGRAVCEAI